MNQEKVLAALAQAQKAHPEMSYDERWNLVMSAQQNALPGDLGAAARKIQASCPGLSFEEAWDMVEREAMPHLRKGETVGQALIRARQSATARPLTAPAEVRATPLEPADIDWPEGKVMLVRGSIGTWVD